MVLGWLHVDAGGFGKFRAIQTFRWVSIALNFPKTRGCPLWVNVLWVDVAFQWRLGRVTCSRCQNLTFRDAIRDAILEPSSLPSAQVVVEVAGGALSRGASRGGA